MSAAATDLRSLQRALMQRVLQGDGAIVGAIAADRIASVERRLRVYADAYRLRLIEVLGKDYPALRALAGAEAFDHLAAEYVAAHPSSTPSVRPFGRCLASWLRERGSPDAWVDMAAFEWAQGDVFDGPDADVATFGDVAVVPPEAWPELRLRIQPAARRLVLAGNTPAQIGALAEDAAIPEWTRFDAPLQWLLWRRGFEIHWRSLEDDESAALSAAQSGESFGALCERLLEWRPAEDVALRAASLLKRWITDELVAGIDLPA